MKKRVFKKDKALFKKAKKIEKSNEAKERKISKVMREFDEDKLHSGSKKGPKVKSRKQAIAIALSEARKVKPARKKRMKRASHDDARMERMEHDRLMDMEHHLRDMSR